LFPIARLLALPFRVLETRFLTNDFLGGYREKSNPGIGSNCNAVIDCLC
jgi:hypothetical protein